MRIVIDTDKAIVELEGEQGPRVLPLASSEAFAAVSAAWLRAGWDAKYVYSFTWLGRPIIQLPEDLLRLQEVLYQVKPTVVIETGVAHGGGLVFYASLLQLFGRGKVIGVDIEIRPQNRAALDAHELRHRMVLLEGSSTAPEIVDQVRAEVVPSDVVLVTLDSNHTAAHVLAELRAYAPLVSVGSYLVAMDGIMQDLANAPRGSASWTHDNPVTAVREFLAENPDFVLEDPPFLFNEGLVRERVTYWPNAYLRRVR